MRTTRLKKPGRPLFINQLAEACSYSEPA